MEKSAPAVKLAIVPNTSAKWQLLLNAHGIWPSFPLPVKCFAKLS
jgi:hypothetical protein